MKHIKQINLFLHVRMDWRNEPEYNAYQTDMSGNKYFGSLVTKKTIDVEFDIPDDFNVNDELVKTLRKQQKTIQADAQMKLTQIEERIQSLLCIEHKAAA